MRMATFLEARYPTIVVDISTAVRQYRTSTSIWRSKIADCRKPNKRYLVRRLSDGVRLFLVNLLTPYLKGHEDVDHLLNDVTSLYIGGVGSVLGSAGPDYFRSTNGLPYYGHMKFESADINDMENDGTLFDVILHEMRHVIGIGMVDSYDGLVD